MLRAGFGQHNGAGFLILADDGDTTEEPFAAIFIPEAAEDRFTVNAKAIAERNLKGIRLLSEAYLVSAGENSGGVGDDGAGGHVDDEDTGVVVGGQARELLNEIANLKER